MAKGLQRPPSLSKQEKRLYRSVVKKIKAAKDKQKRLALIETLTSTKEPWASAVLLDSLDDTNEEIRQLIVQELGERKDLDLELVAEKLDHPLWYVKSSVLNILGLKRDKSVLIHIEALLKEPNVEVRRAAASALGHIGDKESLPLLLQLTKDRNQFVRASAEKAINKVSKLRFT